MKKRGNIIFITSVLVLSLSSIAHAINKIRPQISEATVLGQQLIKELTDNIKIANQAYKNASSAMEKEEAARSARDAAQNFMEALNDIKTFGNDTIRGYNSRQIQIAAITLAELITRLNSVTIEIKSKRMEIADMTDAGVFMDTAIAGKEEQRSKTMKELQYDHKIKKDIQKAIADQEAILGKTWSSTITCAIYNLLVGNSRGICYDIDWTFGGNGPQMSAYNPSAQQSKTPRQKLTKQQHAALKAWNRLSKSELLSKEITSTRQLDEAKNMLDQLNNIKEDLRNVPVKYKDTLYKVNAAADSLEQKMAAAKKNWLKIV